LKSRSLRCGWAAAIVLLAGICGTASADDQLSPPSTLHPQPPARRFAKPSKPEREDSLSGPALTAEGSPSQTKTLQWRSPRRAADPPYRLTSNSAPSGARPTGEWAAKQAERPEAGSDPFSDPFGDGSAIRRQFAKPSSAQAQPSESPSDVLPLTQPPRTLEQELELAQRGIPLPECPSPNDLKSMNQITNSIAAKAGEFPPECSLGDPAYEPRQFCLTTYTWKASGLCHKPLYFEEMALERYGHTWGPFLQPPISAAHFFTSVVLLPYQMGVHPPQECIYDLGYYRYGSCAPQILYTPPLSLRGALAEGLIWTGGVFAFP
jgi:hypothetical protein